MSPMKQRDSSIQDQMKLRRVFYLMYVEISEIRQRHNCFALLIDQTSPVSTIIAVLQILVSALRLLV
jgi:hypothetical protein